MLKYAIVRLLWLIPTVVAAVFLVFILSYFSSGDPIDVMCGPRASPEVRQQVRELFHLDEPILVQAAYFFRNVLRGQLGVSVADREPVARKILRVLPSTVKLAFFSMICTFICAVVLGSLAAFYEGSLLDYVITSGSLAVISIPVFVVAMVLLLSFSINFHIFPMSGAGKPGDILDQLHHLILPSIAISCSWIGFMSRTLKTKMIEVLSSDFVKVERAFGLPTHLVWGKYALRNALLPVATQLGFALGRFLGGAVFVEMIFTRPGIGRLLSTSILSLDYPVVRGTVLVAAAMFVFTNFLSDLSHGLIDPRIRYE